MPPAAPDAAGPRESAGIVDTRSAERCDEVLQPGVELGDLGCSGALLGTEDGSGTGRSQQWARHVACHRDLDATEIDGVVRVDAVDHIKVLGERGHQIACAVEKSVAQRRQHPDAAVGAGATAERQHQTVAGQRQRRPDGFAETVARRAHRGANAAGKGGQPACVRDLHDGGVTVESDYPTVVLAGRPVHVNR